MKTRESLKNKINKRNTRNFDAPLKACFFCPSQLHYVYIGFKSQNYVIHKKREKKERTSLSLMSMNIEQYPNE